MSSNCVYIACMYEACVEFRAKITIAYEDIIQGDTHQYETFE